MTILNRYHESAPTEAVDDGTNNTAVEPVYPYEGMFTSAVLPVDVMVEAVERLTRYRKSKIH